VRAIRDAVGPGVRIDPVVKADAYGHGAVPVALALEMAGTDGLCVATIDEALELRDGGVRVPILVLYPVPPAFVADAAAHRIAVTAGSGPMLDALIDAVAARGVSARSPLEVQVEVETGLGRGGVLPADVDDALARLRSVPAIRMAGIWSHLAAPEDAARSAAQDAVFERVLGAVQARSRPMPRRHLAASGAILAASVPSFDAVRPGLATYGLVPDDVSFEAASGLAAALRPVMALVARPVRVVELPAGHGVGYGPAFVTERPSRLATLPVGYGDGWSRAWSNRTEALVRGVAVPLVGRVSMDAVIADVTDVPGPLVDEADEFVLLGRQGDASIEAGELARRRTTNSWEVVTSMSRRLTRVYHRAGAPEGVRTLTGWRASWHASSSGTGTSATSRSTPS
jgi:alanine racemase